LLLQAHPFLEKTAVLDKASSVAAFCISLRLMRFQLDAKAKHSPRAAAAPRMRLRAQKFDADQTL
jgi:hypothetical protein